MRPAQHTGADANRLLRRFPMSTGVLKKHVEDEELKSEDDDEDFKSEEEEEEDDDDEEDFESEEEEDKREKAPEKREVRDGEEVSRKAAREQVKAAPDRRAEKLEQADKVNMEKAKEKAKEKEKEKKKEKKKKTVGGREDAAGKKEPEDVKVEKALMILRQILQQVDKDIHVAIDLLSVMTPARDAPQKAQEIGRAFDNTDRDAVRQKIVDLRQQKKFLRQQLEERQSLYGRSLMAVRSRLNKRDRVLKAFEGETKFLSRNADLAHYFVEKQNALRAIIQQTEHEIFQTSIDAIGKHIADKERGVFSQQSSRTSTRESSLR
jgi:hypothetical protein